VSRWGNWTLMANYITILLCINSIILTIASQKGG